MRQNCPVCFEYLFDSVRPTAVLPCGHTIHSDCLREMERNRALSCPICLKSYADLAPVWRRMDDEIDDKGRHITGDTLLFLFNSHNEPIPFRLPKHEPNEVWEAVIDTSIDDSLVAPLKHRYTSTEQYPLQDRSLAVLKLSKARKAGWK